MSGAIADALTFRAWDRTSGANGGTADTTVNGTGTAFSAATDTARESGKRELAVIGFAHAPERIDSAAGAVFARSDDGAIAAQLHRQRAPIALGLLPVEVTDGHESAVAHRNDVVDPVVGGTGKDPLP